MLTKPRRGHPPRADKAATERIEIRATRLERAAWEHAAAIADVSLSEWLRALAATECEAVAKVSSTLTYSVCRIPAGLVAWKKLWASGNQSISCRVNHMVATCFP